MGGKNSDDHAIHAAHKRSMKLKVIGALLLCFAVYFFLVVPNVIFDHLRESVGQSAGLVAKFVGASALSPLLAFVLFASDSAFKGGSKGAAWVRSLYPNGIAIERLRCTQKEASTIWFRYFDTWALPGSPNRTILENNYSATYSARMIYYLVRSCIFLSALSGATVLGHCFVFGTYGEVPLRSAWLFVHIGVTCSALPAFVWVTCMSWDRGRGPRDGSRLHA